MRVLFVPMAEGGPAHLIPLLALNKMLAGDPSFETAFLVPRTLHNYLRQFDVEVMDVDYRGWFHNGFRTEMLAYSRFSPAVVVDDTSISTAFASRLAKIPRVTIQRTGSFPFGSPRNKDHRHSLCFVDLKKLSDVTFLGLRQPMSFADLFEAELKIVPGVRSIEVLPPQLQDDPTYVFSGPLLMEDYLAGQVGASFSNNLDRITDLTGFKNFESLQRFFDDNSHRKVVYATFGTIAQPSTPVLDCLRYLLENEIALVSSIEVEGLHEKQRGQYYYAEYLPMHFVCSRVDLMIHQCGSGTYHYPIIHRVPTITVGTRCFDREDVALRLEELNVSCHLLSPDEFPDFTQAFRELISRYFAADGEMLREKKEHLAVLNREIRETSAAFDFPQGLRRAARLSGSEA